MRLRAATRGSALARAQVDIVAALLRQADPSVEVEAVVVETLGDRRRDVPVHEIGGTGVFVKEVQTAVLDGRADIAVHSAKDLPSAPELAPAGLVIAAVPTRADARDALVGSTLAGLPRGAGVGTGSVRRRAQLARLRPDLGFAELRGNIDTRLRRAPEFGAVVVAMAALVRLGREGEAAEALDPTVVVPQVAQGALAVECREGDERTVASLAAIQHEPSRIAVDAERAWLAELGGGCDLPVGAHAVVDAAGGVLLRAVLLSFDGTAAVRDELSGVDPATVGRDLASRMLATEQGAALLAAAGRAAPA